MQIVRTFVWALLLVALLLFSVTNWAPTVTVRIWQGLVVDTKIPAIVIVSFLIGFVPMWLYYRGSKWQTNRRIQSLENAARTASSTPIAPAHTPDNSSADLQPAQSESAAEDPAPPTGNGAGTSDEAPAASPLRPNDQ